MLKGKSGYLIRFRLESDFPAFKITVFDNYITQFCFNLLFLPIQYCFCNSSFPQSDSRTVFENDGFYFPLYFTVA